MKRRILLRKDNTSTSRFLLPTECSEQCEADYRAFEDAIQPRNRLERMYVDEIHLCDVEMRRLRRAALAAVKLALPEAAYDLLFQQLGALEQEAALDLVDRWSRGEAVAIAQVAATLAEHGLDEQILQGEATRRQLRFLTDIEQLTASVVSRRDKALAGIAFCREMERREEQKVTSVASRAIRTVENRPAMPQGRHGN